MEGDRVPEVWFDAVGEEVLDVCRERGRGGRGWGGAVVQRGPDLVRDVWDGQGAFALSRIAGVGGSREGAKIR